MVDFLNDIEREKVISFTSDEVMVEAVRKVILASIYNNGTLRQGEKTDPLKNGALGLAFLALSGRAIITDEQLGQDLRGLSHGINLLEAGFKELLAIKKELKEVATPYNEAI